eukprot:2985836-Pyramimonas_sp.AAC.1
MARPRFSNPFIKLRDAAADTPQANDESEESQEDVYPIFAQYNGKTVTAVMTTGTTIEATSFEKGSD